MGKRHTAASPGLFSVSTVYDSFLERALLLDTFRRISWWLAISRDLVAVVSLGGRFDGAVVCGRLSSSLVHLAADSEHLRNPVLSGTDSHSRACPSIPGIAVPLGRGAEVRDRRQWIDRDGDRKKD